MAHPVHLHRDVRSYLQDLDRDEEQRCYDTLKRCLPEDPFHARAGCDIQPIHGRKRRAFRLRVGDHRVTYVVREGTVLVVEAFHRGRGYR